MSVLKPYLFLFSVNVSYQTSNNLKTDLYPTFLFSGIPTNVLCLYVIHVDLIEPFCRFQLNIQRTACCFELHVVGWFWVDFYHKCQESG